MDLKTCGHCGRELVGAEVDYCTECREGAGRKDRKKILYPAVGIAVLLIAGLVFWYGDVNSWEFSWDALLGRPAAVVNGEPIDRSEARERINVTRLMLEKQYGKGLFADEQGRALLWRLERDVLEKMVEERLVAQEASRLKIQVGDERVQEEIQKISREIYGSRENLETNLREDGISLEYLFNHVRNLLLHQEVKKAKSPPGTDPDTAFVAWLVQNRRNADVTFTGGLASSQGFAGGPGSCCGSKRGGCGAGGCGARQGSDAVDPELKNKASAAALDAYRKTHPAETGLEAKVTDYGCHIQVDIEKGGETVWSYVYQDGGVIDNS